MDSSPTAPTLRSLVPSVFLPTVVYEMGNGAIAPIIALTALDVGASSAEAGFMLAVLGIGQVLGDVPAAALAERIGDRRAMIVAGGLAILALLVCRLAGSLPLLAAGLLVLGMANSVYYLARQAYMTDVVPVGLRARAMSTLGGSHRIGLFVGPFIGAGAIALFGMRSAYVVAMATAAIAAVLLLAFPDVEAADERQRAVRGGTGSLEMLVRHRRLFATLGLAVLAVAAVRAARQTVLPLWAAHIGLGAGTTSLVFGVAGALDVAMFYPSGHVMDRRGRLSIALPSMVVLGAAMMALPLTRTTMTLAIVAMVMSLGNGLGSGILMTLGADAAPVDGRVRFLSVWRIFSDSGNAAGPVVMSIVATVATLAAGIVSVGAVGLLAAVGLAAWVPTHSRLAWPRDVAADAGG